jgi:ribosomal protein S18 acetylase RimI-like enzyme
MELRRIYAVQEFIGKGVGKELMYRSIHEARQRDCDVIWLGVWEKNQRAIDFYKKWGFREVGAHLFALGDEPQNDLLMALDLI